MLSLVEGHVKVCGLLLVYITEPLFNRYLKPKVGQKGQSFPFVLFWLKEI